MKILFVIPYQFLPPDSGNKNLLYNLLKYVTKEAHCDLALLLDESASVSFDEASLRREYPELGAITVFAKPRGGSLLLARLKMLARRYHPSMGRYMSGTLASWLASKAAKGGYDLIHFDMIHTASYRRFCGDMPTVLVASDAYSMAAKGACVISRSLKDRARLRVEGWLIENFERDEYLNFSAVCTVSERDAAYLAANSPTATIRTIGIAVAREYAERKILHFGHSRQEQKILCTGSLDHSVVADAIVEFLQESLPLIRKAYAGVKVTVLGKSPVSELKQCMQTTAGVEHVEYVQDYAEFLDQDWVYIHPQPAASGMQTKLQQAMALGLPVVAYEVSFGGLSVESGKHCFICKSGDEMNEYVLQLIGDEKLRREIGLNAAEYVREMFSIDRIGRLMIALYREAIASKSLNKFSADGAQALRK